MEYTEPFKSSEVTSYTVHQLDCRKKCRFTNYKSRNPGGGTRGAIRELSRQSRTRLVYSARNTPGLSAILTFTYPDEKYSVSASGGDYMRDGRIVKEHFRRIRQWLTYRGIYGIWVVEFQKRGAPHFHLFLGGNLQAFDEQKIKRNWFKLVGSSCPHHQERGLQFAAMRKVHAAGAYAAKYSSKSEQKTVPARYKDVGRFWGKFGDIPDSRHEIITSVREIHQIARIARNYARSLARSGNYKLKSNHRKQVTETQYNVAPAVLTYLSRCYTIPENQSEISLINSNSRSPASEYPRFERTEASNVQPGAP